MQGSDNQHHQHFLGVLRPAGAWLIFLLCLALTMPLLGFAAPAKEATNRHLEFTSPDLGPELLDIPVERPASGKQSFPCPETAAVPCGAGLPGQLLFGRYEFLRIAITAPWLTGSHPLFLPRPPPRS